MSNMPEVKPDSTLTSPPPNKKFKQTRLQFSVISGNVQSPQTTPTSGKKRKLSDSASGPSKASKTPRSDENSPKIKPSPGRKVQDADNEVSSSSETDSKAKQIENHTDEKAKKLDPFRNFKRSAQQPQVTTTISADSSGIIDLTDSHDGVTVSAESENIDSGEPSKAVSQSPEKTEKTGSHESSKALSQKTEKTGSQKKEKAGSQEKEKTGSQETEKAGSQETNGTDEAEETGAQGTEGLDSPTESQASESTSSEKIQKEDKQSEKICDKVKEAKTDEKNGNEGIELTDSRKSETEEGKEVTSLVKTKSEASSVEKPSESKESSETSDSADVKEGNESKEDEQQSCTEMSSVETPADEASDEGSSHGSGAGPSHVRTCYVRIQKLNLANHSKAGQTSREAEVKPADDSHDDSDKDTSLQITSPKPSTTPKSDGSKSGKKRTPSSRQVAEKQRREEEREKAKIQKQKEKEEKEQQRKEEKEKKDREKEELRKKREQEKKEKLEQKEKERLEKLKQKEEEKQKKEEERLQKKKELEDKKKKELEDRQRQKEEAEKEKQRQKEEKEMEKLKEMEGKNKTNSFQKQAFMSFFTKKEKPDSTGKVEEVDSRFLQFEVKKDMKIAPLLRYDHADLSGRLDKLDHHLSSQECKKTYLKKLRSIDYTVGTSEKTWPSEEEDVVCMEEDKKPKERMRVKFLKFHENYRPPYYGTWRKRSKYICARRPLGKDTVQLDYEVDSDDEWEEEEPGESLSDCENNKEEEEDGEEEDDEDDDGFFVPHGYLSEGEGCEDDEDDANPEKLKMRQMAKAKRWESEMSAKVSALRSMCTGCLWWNPHQPEPRTPEYDELKKYTVVSLMPMPISTVIAEKTKSEKAEAQKKKKGELREKYKPVPEEAIPDLVRLVHGNPWSINKLLTEFREYWRRRESGVTAADSAAANSAVNTSQGEQEESAMNTSQEENSPSTIPGLAKSQIAKTIRELADYGTNSAMANCWIVQQQVLEKHNLTDLPVPNQWKWVTKQPGKKRKIPTPSPHPTPTPDNASTPVPTKETATSKEGNTPDIMKFAVPGVSPKFPAKDIKDLKESNKTVALAKDTLASSILKFAKPGITPSFPVISPKPVKATEQASPLCSTPKSSAASDLAGKPSTSTPNIPSIAKSAVIGSADTPKRQPNKQKNRSSLFSSTTKDTSVPMDTSTNENKDEDEDCVVMSIELLKPDKNQPTMKQMFGKKPATPSVKKPVAKKSTPVAKKSTLVPKESTPDANKTNPAAKKSTPVAKKSTPVPKESTDANKTNSVAKKSTPVAKKSNPVPKESTPGANKTNSVAKKSTPVAKKSTPVAKKSTPVAKQPITSVVATDGKQPTSSPVSSKAKSPGASISTIAARLQAFATSKNAGSEEGSPKSAANVKPKAHKVKSPVTSKKLANAVVTKGTNAKVQKEKASVSGQGTEACPMEID